MTEGIFKPKRTILENSIIESYFNENNELVKIEKFDKTNKKLKLSEITFKDNGRTPEKQIQYEYNETNNKLIKTTTCDNNNNTITIEDNINNTITTCDNNNNTITIEDNINNTITTETYHSNGKIKERIIKDKKNNNIISTRNFNENGICTSETVYNTEGQKTFKREFYEDGKTVKCLHTYENGKRIKSELFDTKNNKIQEDIYCSFDDTKIEKSTTYDPQTKRITKDVYLDGLGQIDRQVQYTYTETATRLDTYNSNGKKTKTEIFDKEKNNKIEEQKLNDDEQVIQITKFYPNKEKDLKIFFDNDGKIEKLKTYHKNKCNREYIFQNIVNFDRDKFLNLSTVERETQLDQLIETNTKYYTEYDNGKKIREAFYRENGTKEKMVKYENDGKSIETIIFCDTNGAEIDIVDKSKLQEYSEKELDIKTLMVSIDDKDKSIKYHKICDNTTKSKRYTYTFTYKNNKRNTIIIDIGNKKYSEIIFKKDSENIEIINEYYDNGTKSCEFFLKENGKTTEKKITYNEDGKKTTETFLKEDGKTIEKTIYYENDGKGIKGIGFYNAYNEIIDIITESELQELLKDLDNNKCDIETLTMSIDKEDSSIKHYSAYNKTDKKIEYESTYKGDKKLNTTPIINENNELQTTLSSVQSASGELLDKEKDGLQQPFN